MDRQDIFAKIDKEREHQDQTWGHEFDDKNTVNDWLTYMAIYQARAAEMDRETKVLDIDQVKKNVLKSITIGVAMLETIERNENSIAPRHYDRKGDEQ